MTTLTGPIILKIYPKGEQLGGTLMQINQATDYGFRVILFLSGKPRGEIVEAQVIADSEAIPMRYLFKIMPSLTRVGILNSHRGVGGGYALARDPAEVSLLDVIEAIEGPIMLNRCFIDEENCSKHGPPECKVHQALNIIQRRLSEDFKSINFKQLSG